MSSRVRTENSSKYGAVIILPEKGNDFGFRFGIAKARLILEHLNEIRAFVDAIDGKPAPRQPAAVPAAPKANGAPIVWSDPAGDSTAIVIRHTPGNGNGWQKPAAPQPAPRKLSPLPLSAALEDRLADEARESATCYGCGSPKDNGLIVCWDCLKRHPVAPLKNWMAEQGKDFSAWLNLYGKGAK